jgi:hypothetical protein
MKKTAVEWFVEQLKERHLLKFTGIDKIIEQAKEMEKEQIINAWSDGKFESSGCIEAEQYYNETFKSE